MEIIYDFKNTVIVRSFGVILLYFFPQIFSSQSSQLNVKKQQRTVHVGGLCLVVCLSDSLPLLSDWTDFFNCLSKAELFLFQAGTYISRSIIKSLKNNIIA